MAGAEGWVPGESQSEDCWCWVDETLARRRANGSADGAPGAGPNRSAPEPDRPRRISAAHLAQMILGRGHRFARDAGGLLYLYKDGVYRPEGERFIQAEAKRALAELGAAEQWSSHKCGEAARWIAADCPVLWDRPPADVVNVRNGLLDVNTGELRPHSPDFLSPVQLPVRFDPDARCPGWEAFVEATFPPDALEIAWEIPGWLMVPDTSLQKAVMLTGDGANGKSRYLAGLQTFLGGDNVAAIPLQKLEEDRFAAARLLGKLANIYADLPAKALEKSEVFKMLTGGDTIACERKFQESFEARLFCRMVFSCNNPPQIRDATNAFFRRWVVIPFECTLHAEDLIPADELDALLGSPEELSGLLNRALEGLRRLRARKAFPQAKSLEEALHAFREACDPLAAWLDRVTIPDPDGWIEAEALYRGWMANCQEQGLTVMSRESFGRSIRRIRPHWVIERPRAEDGSRPRGYRGVAWREVTV